VGALALGTVGFGSTAAFAKSTPTVGVAKVKGLGKVLVDSKGKTLYTLTNGGTAVACSSACAAAWPPLTSSSTPTGSKGVEGLGVDGKQVTVDGLPVYRFTGDTKKGQAAGEGISSFGGVWHVVTTDASASSSSGSGSSSSDRGGDYGY
jgi:predicted lipoprotein with Yx(FWY)xxD motif